MVVSSGPGWMGGGLAAENRPNPGRLGHVGSPSRWGLLEPVSCVEVGQIARMVES